MVVVILMAGGALIALRTYNGMAINNPALLERALFSIRQQAGVMAAFCAAVFAVLTALQKGTGPITTLTGAVSNLPTFGRPASALSGAQ